MTNYTRRTHIVRISDAKPGEPPSKKYIDVEVLDAIAFRTANGKEVILNMDASKSDPLIVDETGGGHDKAPAEPTQRTHMKRITSRTDPAQKLDVEVMDVLAFRDQRGEEWILDMQATTGEGPAIFDQTDNTGASASTRRVHDEIISKPNGKSKLDVLSDPAVKYLTSQRCDAIAFRTVLGKEVIFSCPSNDDPNSSDKRAPTFTTPTGYDPKDETSEAVIPPSLSVSGDKNNYISFVDGAAGFMTGAEKISMGPFWWIRKVASGGGFIVVDWLFHGTMLDFTVTLGGFPPILIETGPTEYTPPPPGGGPGGGLGTQTWAVVTAVPGWPPLSGYPGLYEVAFSYSQSDALAYASLVSIDYPGTACFVVPWPVITDQSKVLHTWYNTMVFDLSKLKLDPGQKTVNIGVGVGSSTGSNWTVVVSTYGGDTTAADFGVDSTGAPVSTRPSPSDERTLIGIAPVEQVSNVIPGQTLAETLDLTTLQFSP
jgi:hypothetical protein